MSNTSTERYSQPSLQLPNADNSRKTGSMFLPFRQHQTGCSGQSCTAEGVQPACRSRGSGSTGSPRGWSRPEGKDLQPWRLKHVKYHGQQTDHKLLSPRITDRNDHIQGPLSGLRRYQPQAIYWPTGQDFLGTRISRFFSGEAGTAAAWATEARAIATATMVEVLNIMMSRRQ